MKRQPPEVRLDNYRAVYNHYADLQPNVRTTRTVHRILRAFYQPNTHVAPSVADRIGELLDNNTRLVIVANHISKHDPPVLAAAAQAAPALRPLIGNTFILAKDGLFRHRGVRQAVEVLGAVPVFRDQDYGSEAGQARAAQALKRMSIERLHSGQNMAVLPEATVNDKDPTKLQRFKGGWSLIVHEALEEGSKIAILPFAFSYPLAGSFSGEVTHHHADVVATEPLTELEGLRASQIQALTRTSLQAAVDLAVGYSTGAITA